MVLGIGCLVYTYGSGDRMSITVLRVGLERVFFEGSKISVSLSSGGCLNSSGTSWSRSGITEKLKDSSFSQTFVYTSVYDWGD